MPKPAPRPDWSPLLDRVAVALEIARTKVEESSSAFAALQRKVYAGKADVSDAIRCETAAYDAWRACSRMTAEQDRVLQHVKRQLAAAGVQTLDPDIDGFIDAAKAA
jgi:hypothetical protein